MTVLFARILVVVWLNLNEIWLRFSQEISCNNILIALCYTPLSSRSYICYIIIIIIYLFCFFLKINPALSLIFLTPSLVLIHVNPIWVHADLNPIAFLDWVSDPTWYYLRSQPRRPRRWEKEVGSLFPFSYLFIFLYLCDILTLDEFRVDIWWSR